MKSIRNIRRRLAAAAFALTFGLGAAPAGAVIILYLDVTPSGGNYHYDVSIDNGEAVDMVLVSLFNAPLGDALIEATLVAPAGFLANYDSGLGIIDFLGDTSDFSAGTITPGFSFDSLVEPAGFFTAATGYDGSLTEYDAEVRINQNHSVPEPGGTFLPLALGLCALIAGRMKLDAVRRRIQSLFPMPTEPTRHENLAPDH